jgi:hypothetical protein
MARTSATSLLRYVHKLVDTANDAHVLDGELLRRFTVERSELAFQALFRRHAPMVLAVGRRVAGSEHDAEDICQATFLLLAQKAFHYGQRARWRVGCTRRAIIWR